VVRSNEKIAPTGQFFSKEKPGQMVSELDHSDSDGEMTYVER